jgi:hypothetical protein
VHATLAQPAAGADDALKDLRAQRALHPKAFPLKIPCDFLKTSGWIFGPEHQNSQDFLHAYNAQRSLARSSQDPVLHDPPGITHCAAMGVPG